MITHWERILSLNENVLVPYYSSKYCRVVIRKVQIKVVASFHTFINNSNKTFNPIKGKRGKMDILNVIKPFIILNTYCETNTIN